MKRLYRRMPRHFACLFLLATIAAWPTAGWSRAAKQACNFDLVVHEGLKNWAAKLGESSPTNPEPIVSTYAKPDAVLVPTCSNGPLGYAAIRGYFKDKFLPLEPKATFDWNSVKAGGDCTHAFASGRYSFKLKDGKVLQARFTYIFRRPPPGHTVWPIAQHHSSLVLDPAQTCPSH